MGWHDILKRDSRSIRQRDIRTIRYVMRDGNFRTQAAILDEIFELIAENKKLGSQKAFKQKGSEAAVRRFSATRRMIESQLNTPEYESRDSGNKTYSKRPILEYRYIGVQ
tara:strand:+ start:581 stop:910 length:330 start_codon:yes stop_codon:yes gene_type:complete